MRGTESEINKSRNIYLVHEHNIHQAYRLGFQNKYDHFSFTKHYGENISFFIIPLFVKFRFISFRFNVISHW